ncbi:hypothetical protein WJX74_001400 [Apatococcus lobatus]|uniref:Transmembrane protein n=1 Tax=Apatococcus lobatus TaxID=904363 RepID=A0AAW1QK54_9CHLO
MYRGSYAAKHGGAGFLDDPRATKYPKSNKDVLKQGKKLAVPGGIILISLLTLTSISLAVSRSHIAHAGRVLNGEVGNLRQALQAEKQLSHSKQAQIDIKDVANSKLRNELHTQSVEASEAAARLENQEKSIHTTADQLTRSRQEVRELQGLLDTAQGHVRSAEDRAHALEERAKTAEASHGSSSQCCTDLDISRGRIEELVRETLRLQDRANSAEKRLLSSAGGSGGSLDPVPQAAGHEDLQNKAYQGETGGVNAERSGSLPLNASGREFVASQGEGAVKPHMEADHFQHHLTNLALDSGLFERMAIALEHQGIADPSGHMQLARKLQDLYEGRAADPLAHASMRQQLQGAGAEYTSPGEQMARGLIEQGVQSRDGLPALIAAMDAYVDRSGQLHRENFAAGL